MRAVILHIENNIFHSVFRLKSIKVEKDWKHRVRAKKLGKTASGQPVNMEHYDNLVAMEFPKGAAAEALRQTNNNFDSALEVWILLWVSFILFLWLVSIL